MSLSAWLLTYAFIRIRAMKNKIKNDVKNGKLSLESIGDKVESNNFYF